VLFATPDRSQWIVDLVRHRADCLPEESGLDLVRPCHVEVAAGPYRIGQRAGSLACHVNEVIDEPASALPLPHHAVEQHKSIVGVLRACGLPDTHYACLAKRQCDEIACGRHSQAAGVSDTDVVSSGGVMACEVTCSPEVSCGMSWVASGTAIGSGGVMACASGSH